MRQEHATELSAKGRDGRAPAPKRRLAQWMCGGASAALSLWAGGVQAQTAAPKPAAAQNDAALIEEVIVTSQRREERLQDVPIAVTAISGKVMAERAFTDPSQVQYVAPSLQTNGVSAAPGVNNYAIRGIGTASFSNAIEYSVSTVIDDVVLARPEMGAVQFFDLDRIEVLRGPQGTLFGKNASAGVVNIVTTRPKLDTFEGAVRLGVSQVQAGKDGTAGQFNGVVNIPVSANSALRISAFGVSQPELIDNVLPNDKSDFGMRQAGARVKYLWAPNDKLEIYAIADYAREKGSGSGAFAFRKLPSNSPLAASAAANHIVAGPDNVQNAAGADYGANYQVGGAQVNLTYEGDSGYTITNILAARQYKLAAKADTDLLPINFFDQNNVGIDDRQFSNELRIASPAGRRFVHQFGLYLYEGRFERIGEIGATNGLATFPPGNTGARGGRSVAVHKAKSAALFGQGTFEVTPKLRLLMGARVTYDEIKLNAVATQGPNQVAFFGVGTLDQARDNTNLSYMFGAQYDVSDDVMAYVTHARGYKGPAFNNTVLPVVAVRVDPEIPVSTEVGLKMSFGRRLTLNLAAFDETFKDYQAVTLDPATLRGVLQNAGSVTSRGFEAEMTAKWPSGASVTGGLTYVDAKYRDFPGVPCYVGQPGCLPNNTKDVSGNRLVNSPKLTANLTLGYERAVGKDLVGFASVSGYTRSKSNFSANGDPNTEVGAYSLFDASLGLRTADDRWRVTVFGRNLSDERFPAAIQTNAASTIAYQQSFNVSSFRTIGVTLDHRF